MKFYSAHARLLPDIHVGSSVTVQNPQAKLWDIYGTVTEIGPRRRYYIKTHSGCVLDRNCQFLHRRVPPPPAPSLAVIPPMNTSQEAKAATTTPQSLPPRCSSCTCNLPQRLIEDPTLYGIYCTLLILYLMGREEM